MTTAAYTLGRRFMADLPRQADLMEALEHFCRTYAVQAGVFSVIGALTSATIGAFDQKQQVYVTHQEVSHLEIVSCMGNISMENGQLCLKAHAMLADCEGHVTGGRLFSESPIFYAELDLQEFIGQPMVRAYDPLTGLQLWSRGASNAINPGGHDASEDSKSPTIETQTR
jgi:predicted DNA-binding protein with PD1-like motif